MPAYDSRWFDPPVSFHPESRPAKRADQYEASEKRVMATFYLPPDLVDQLDLAWLERRRKDRKVQKSRIVEEALAAYLKMR